MSRATKGVRPPRLRPKAAYEALSEDIVLGPWVRAIGWPRIRRVAQTPFAYLARSIVYQQLAGAAAATIHGRFEEAVGGRVTATSVARTSDDALRAAGLSRGKLASIRDLAARAPRMGLTRLDRLPDDEVLARLTTVRGIGPWTAHMYLIFFLRRPDVWPVGDLGVRSGYAKVHGLDAVPAEKDMRLVGDAYRPWRSAASWYFWRALEMEAPTERM